MEDFGFDINGLLSPEEAEKVFNEAAEETEEKTEETEQQTKEETTEKEETPLEKVGEEETKENAVENKEEDGSSPETNVYSSIAGALSKDGIFPDFDDSEISKVKTADDFAELFEKAITARLDERQRRIDSALNDGVAPDEVKMYEQTLQYLSSITEDALSAEGKEGEDLRRNLIYNDLINRGYQKDRALRELDKSFKSGSDVDDAKDALEALTKFYTDGYDGIRKEAKANAEAKSREQKQNAEKFKKMVLDDDVKFGDSVIDKKTCQKVYDAVSKPVYKDPSSGALLTQVQKFQLEHPLEFLKNIGLWFVLTDGGKNPAGLFKEQLRAEKNKSIKELEKHINTTPIGSDGNLRYTAGNGGSEETLLTDDWEIGWK